MILEIGPRPYVALAFPEASAFFSTGENPPSPHLRQIRSMAELTRMIGSAETELIACHPNFVSPWTARHINRNIVSRRFIEGRSPLIRAIAPELLRRPRRARLIVLDHEDLPVINRDNLFLLERCDLWFKRELPADHWRVFTKTAHPQLPTPRFRLRPRNLRWVEKLRPLSIGLPLGVEELLPLPPGPEKRVDVFFSGRVTGSSTLRARGLDELKALERRGVTLDIPGAPLPRPEFYQRCGAARLVWSPEGLGWDCFRHYEAGACGSVPLINQPWLDRHAPLIGGEHALYYDVEPGGLARAVTAALADKDALARIAAAAQAHVMAHHTPRALAAYVVAEARAL